MVKNRPYSRLLHQVFQVSSPSILIPELQGRLPIRVELQRDSEDFERIQLNLMHR